MDYFTDSLLAALRLIGSFDAATWRIVGTSLYIALISTLLAALAGIPLGVTAALGDFPGRRALRQLLHTLMAMPTVMIGLIFYGLLSRRGPLGELGLLYTRQAVILGETTLILPIVMNLAWQAVEDADPALATTLKTLGANFRQTASYLAREVRRALLAAAVMGFGRAIGEIGAAMMLGGNIAGLTRTMTTAIALETGKGEFEQGLALGLALLGVAGAVNAFLFRLRPERAP
ncbi:MAG TPA: ABC transporter permease [Methylococcaceae bacterium]|nr:ABC transporter permease [Methylococcaceae bacterium]